jgi:hypothetical protein
MKMNGIDDGFLARLGDEDALARLRVIDSRLGELWREFGTHWESGCEGCPKCELAEVETDMLREEQLRIEQRFGWNDNFPEDEL